MNIEIIAGSPRQGSLSLRVAQHLFQKFQKEVPQHHTGLINMQDVHLPFVQSVWQTTEHIPAEFSEIGNRMFNANAFIIVSPEYNGGYSPAMKNLFDHFPKQTGKAFGIATSSPGVLGGMRAAQQLLQLVPALMGVASPSLLIVPTVDKRFDENAALLDAAYQKNVDGFVKDFLWLAERLA